MKPFIALLLFFYMALPQSYAQTTVRKEVYKLNSKRFVWVPDSVVYKDSIDLNPFKGQANSNQISICVMGLEQQIRIDINCTDSDTTALITAYTYELKPSHATRADKKMFPKLKIVSKVTWNLKMKTSAVADTMLKSLLNILKHVNFDSLPNSDSISKDLGIVQFDGHIFEFELTNRKQTLNYKVCSLHLNQHEMLKNLLPIEALILNYIQSRPELKVEYQKNTCYNSGGANISVCKY